MAERDAVGNGGASSRGSINNLRDRRAAYLPDGYELVPAGDEKRLRLLRPDGSEVRSFEKGEINEAERAALEDLRNKRHEKPL